MQRALRRYRALYAGPRARYAHAWGASAQVKLAHALLAAQTAQTETEPGEAFGSADQLLRSAPRWVRATLHRLA